MGGLRVGAGSDRFHPGAPCCGSFCSLVAQTASVGLHTKKQSRRADCKEKNGDISQFGVGKIRAVFHAKERVKIRNSKRLGIQSLFLAQAIEEAAEKRQTG